MQMNGRQWGDTLEELSTAVSDIDGKLDRVEDKLAAIEDAVEDIDAEVEFAQLQHRDDTREIIQAVWRVGTLVALACWVMIIFGGSGRSNAVSAPPAAPAAPPVIIVTNVASGSAPFVFDLDTLLGAVTGRMGKKVEDNWMPKEPLPHQKRAPCDGSLGEEDVNGNCWVAPRNVKPPCGRLFRYGDECYRPVAADPEKPVGSSP